VAGVRGASESRDLVRKRAFNFPRAIACTTNDHDHDYLHSTEHFPKQSATIAFAPTSTTTMALARELTPDQRTLNDMIDQFIQNPEHCEHSWLQIVRRLQHDQAQMVASCKVRETQIRQSNDQLLKYALKKNDELRALHRRLPEAESKNSRLRNAAVYLNAEVAQGLRLHNAIVKDNELLLNSAVGQVQGVNGWYTSGETSSAQYANPCHQQLTTNINRSSDINDETCEEPPRKKRLRSSARTSLPKNVVMCTQCYANGFECDHGDSCVACIESGKQCKRKQCETYALGPRQCEDVHCRDAHPEDGYTNTMQILRLRRKDGLPPVLQIFR
jgi:hypothetical protein